VRDGNDSGRTKKPSPVTRKKEEKGKEKGGERGGKENQEKKPNKTPLHPAEDARAAEVRRRT